MFYLATENLLKVSEWVEELSYMEISIYLTLIQPKTRNHSEENNIGYLSKSLVRFSFRCLSDVLLC